MFQASHGCIYNGCITSLNVALQQSHESLCLSDVKTYINKTQDALKKLVIKGHWFEEEKFKKLKQIAADQTSFPPSANHRKMYYLNGMNLKRTFIPSLYLHLN